MTRINAYLAFGGDCRQAMSFYKECLGGELTMQTVGESPMAEQMPPEAQQQIMHASLVKDELVLMASDMLQGELLQGNTMSLLLDCGSEEEVKRFFSGLSAGGKVNAPLMEQFWGATFGDLTDRFGVRWMLNYAKPKA